jgi:hypothetical protein
LAWGNGNRCGCPASWTAGFTPTRSSPPKSDARLFVEDFFYVADLLLNLAGNFFIRATISQMGIADGFAALLFHFAFGFPKRAFDFVFCARFHE